MPFKCAVCLEDKRTSRSNTIILPNDDQVCSDCFSGYVVEQFWNSIRNTAEFPFRWGEKVVRFQDYARHIPAYILMLRAYNAKKDELETPAELRVYCDRDGEYLGQKKTAAQLELENLTGSYECEICGRLICKMCKNHAAANHKCPKEAAENDAFKGMKKGEEYQLCPKCSAPHYLGDGCNACSCRVCRTQFCFVCSETVKHGDKTHWQLGMRCPRFNQPGAINAMFDNEVNVVDDPIPDEEEEVLRGRPVLWNQLLRARVVPARDYLRDIRRAIRAGQEEAPQQRFNAHLEHTVELIQNLSRNYGIFNLSDEGRIAPTERILDQGRAVLERHEQIRDFADFPAAEWAWVSFPRLRTLRMWYLNHVRLDEERTQGEGNGHGRLKMWFVYGNPEMEDALQGQWWFRPAAK